MFVFVLVGFANSSSAGRIWGSTGSSSASLNRRGAHIVKFDSTLNHGLRGTSTNLALRGGERQHGLRFAIIPYESYHNHTVMSQNQQQIIYSMLKFDDAVLLT